MRASVLVLGLLLAGCAGSGTWMKSVLSDYPGNVQQAQFECERDVRQSDFGNSLLTPFAVRSFYADCMRAKGFYLEAPVP